MNALRRIWQDLRPVLTGWLVVALLLPSLLSIAAPQAVAHQSELAAICASEDGKLPAQHQHQSDECPCCLPGAVGFTALPPRDATVLPAPLYIALANPLAPSVPVYANQIARPRELARGPPVLSA